MKKIMQKTTLLLSCLFLSYLAHAQFSIGFKTGVNIASQEIELSGLSTKTGDISGLVLGAIITVPISEKLFLQPELMFIQKGSGSGFELEEDAKIRLNYFEIPILIKYNFLNKPNFKLNLIGGPSFGFGLDGTATYGDEVETISFSEGEIKRLDTGFHFGIGASKKFGNMSLFIDIRYLAGLTNLVLEEGIKLTNEGANGNIGILFPLSKK